MYVLFRAKIRAGNTHFNPVYQIYCNKFVRHYFSNMELNFIAPFQIFIIIFVNNNN